LTPDPLTPDPLTVTYLVLCFIYEVENTFDKERNWTAREGVIIGVAQKNTTQRKKNGEHHLFVEELENCLEKKKH
jgi:hypothetical protein